MSGSRGRLSSALWPLGLSLVLLLPTAGPVAADTELGHTGTVGNHNLSDIEKAPGVTCKHGKRSGRLLEMVVAPPTVYASSGVFYQQVGWRFVIQRRAAPKKPWKQFHASPIEKGGAYAPYWAIFPARSASLTLPAADTKQTRYRVIVVMFWYGEDGKQVGRARHLVDWYGPYGPDKLGKKGGCRARLV